MPVLGEPIDLKFHPAKGSVTKLKATLDQKVTQTVGGTPSTVGQSVTLVYSMATEDVAGDGTATVRVTYDAVAFKQQAPGGVEVEYDSAKPPATIPPVARGFAALVGLGVTIKVSPAGHVTDVQGVDEMIDGIIKKLEIPDGPSKPLLEKSLRKDFGPDAVRDNMETMLLIYPDKPVSVGDSWTRHMTITKGFPIVLDNAFTLKDVSGDAATLEVKSKLTNNADAPPLDLGQRKLSYQLSGEQNGTIKLKRVDGMIVSADMKQIVDGKMIAEAEGEGKTEVPLHVETHITMETK